MRQLLERLTGFGEARPRLTLLLVGALALTCAGVSLRLTPSSNVNTLVSSSARDYQATQKDYQQFGGDAVTVLVREPLQNLLGSRDLRALSELEACLAGQRVSASISLRAFVPVQAARARPYGGAHSPCGHLRAARPAQVVYGPATFLNQAVIAVNRQLNGVLASARNSISSAESTAAAEAKAKGQSATQQKAAAQAAGASANRQEEAQLTEMAVDSGLSSLTSLPGISNTAFIRSVVFDPSRGSDTPKARFSYLFPTSDSALIQVRLKPNLTSVQTARAIGWIRAATQMKLFALGSGASYLVSGQPVVLNDVSAMLSGQVARLLIDAVLVMAIVLLLVFHRRRRLLPLALALAATAITFGLCAIAGGSLTMASIAVLPILIGVAVDYGIQLQSRASGAPTIAAAALATATGFLVLLLSPVPMVRGFGLLLVVGVVIAFIVVMGAGSAALALDERRVGLSVPMLRSAPAAPASRALASGGSVGTALAASVRGAGELLAVALHPLGRGVRAARHRIGAIPEPRRGRRRAVSAPSAGRLALLTARPRSVLAVALMLAVAGWLADTQTSVQSDITKLVPSKLPALSGLNTLERTTGESGELDVLVHAKHVATPATVAWMVGYEQQIAKHFGYVEEKGCKDGGATVCPALSLPDLFSGSTSSSGTSASRAKRGTSTSSATLTQGQINTLLEAVPAYLSQAVIDRDRTYASLSFGIRLMPLARQIRVVDFMRSHLHPPAGISARLAGLPVLAADADGALSSASRRLLTLLAGLGAVALMLLALFRTPSRALVPLVPIVLATGWSALIVWLIGIPLNPMSATLGALVIAISTEFSVLLSERFRRQRQSGEEPGLALANAYRSTGRAVLASGVTAIAGFAVLIVSDVTMLRDFGLVTLIDMSVSLLGVLAVLPAVLTLADRDGRIRLAPLSLRRQEHHDRVTA